ncbi:MAG: M28 family peptidase [Gammaproteobacteria bacterium]|nr:M28 family peptidase [Gammaproteobacteria bacterium]MBU1556601.1 M28 family peptidase [Gammaproteobacteria bacterium]MBU2069742.1 M28 family peptidase [Gammaproteobacteria bacterium]MBU2184607.1 M28 family peptidase [Gammaproteobacteria bacterium]MBU2205727.1 M28 family peptidase [Gammaproteobacteria bacterium]
MTQQFTPLLLAAASASLLLVSCSNQNTTSPAEQSLLQTSFNANFAGYFQKIASDDMQGRAPATKGEENTVQYLEQQFSRLGLTPYSADSYRQSVPVVQIDPVKVSALTLTDNRGGNTSLSYKTDMMAWSTRMLQQIDVTDSQVVFVGYGIVAPEYNWNDYAGLDVKGKTVVMLVNDPGYATQDPTLFTGNAMTYYGRWTYKYEEAARQGAAMALIVHETDAASYGWNVVAGTSPIRFELANDNKNLHKAPVEGWLSLDAAEKLFAANGTSLKQLREQALSKAFKPVPLNAKASLSISNNLRELNSSNVIGYIEGSEKPDEAIIYMAHWDHFGLDFSRPDDKVFNGAQDNAGGVAALLALAEQFKAGPPPKRSVAFLAVTVEERGLLGSAWYASNPLFALNKTVAGINMDVINVYGPMRDVMVFGYGSSELEPILEKYARAQNRYIAPEPTPQDGFYYRSDHFNLAKKGVPMLYARGGVDSFIHGKDWGLKQRRLYVRDYYHKVNDEFDANWDLRGAQQDLHLYYQVGHELANSDSWPNWYQGKEFRAVRAASLAQ